MQLALFDFDGTITDRDSFIDFLRYNLGLPRLILGFIVLCPFVALYLARIMPNWKAKEKVLRRFFNGWRIRDFDKAAATYSRDRIPLIVKEIALERIRWHRDQGHKIVVVSASLEAWLKEWCTSQGAELIATRLEVSGGLMTGMIAGKNCHGPEKVRRIKEKVRLEQYEYIYAYGNSSGDKEMLELADEQFYNWKRIV